MTDLQQKAIDKINGEKCAFADQNKSFVYPYVRDILLYFVNESPAFAEAVLDEKKSLKGCIDSLKLVGKRASDLDVYKECVSYYYPGAIVECKLTIKVPNETKRAKILEFRLEDFL